MKAHKNSVGRLFKLPKIFINTTSLLGAVVASLGLGASTLALLFDIFTQTTRPYQGILTFFAFPAFLFAGFGIILLGALRERRRLKRGGVGPAGFPVIDFNDPRKRRFYLTFGAVSLILLLLSILGSYRAFEFTESVTFCGQLCHTVMEPEFTAYQNSPHARLKCVECHVGPGAEWYVKAKISGLYQIYAVLADKYPRPIPTPIENLRPSRDTCEQCHWPEKFWGAQLSTRMRFQYDAGNSPMEILMLVKTGGGSPVHGKSEGIHWQHLSLNNEIEYIARDDRRMDIPWVRTTSRDGTVREYLDPERPPTEEELRTRERRQMDCIDCHTRPSHVYLSPEEAVDLSLQTGALDRKVPSIKQAAVEALAAGYASREEADLGIERSLRDFYSKKDSKIEKEVQGKIPAIAEELRRIHRRNFFPEMKADWSVYPNQIGHRLYPGCFRCHDDKHKSGDGKVLSKDCDLCHTVLERDRESFVPMPAALGFAHPFKAGVHFRKKECWDCHTGKGPPYGACGSCHETRGASLESFSCTACHGDVTEHPVLHWPVSSGVCTACHRTVGGEKHTFADRGDERQLCLSCHSRRLGAEGERRLANVGRAIREGRVSHEPAAKGKCTACHDPHGSEAKGLLVAPEEDLCGTCHGGLLKTIQAGRFRHGPVEKGQCTGCHDPHASPYEGILVERFNRELYVRFAEEEFALCFKCHERKLVLEDSTETATGFRDGMKNLHALHVKDQEKGRSCNLCHEIHASELPKLLRREVPFGKGGWQLPIGWEPAPDGGRCASGCHEALSYSRAKPSPEPPPEKKG